MPRKRRAGKTRVGYNHGDRGVLQYGVDFFGDATLDPKDLKECRIAWQALGEDILAHWLDRIRARAGTRPWGWWVFDQGFDRKPSHEEQAVYLREQGLLTEAEKTELRGRAQAREHMSRGVSHVTD